MRIRSKGCFFLLQLTPILKPSQVIYPNRKDEQTSEKSKKEMLYTSFLRHPLLAEDEIAGIGGGERRQAEPIVEFAHALHLHSRHRLVGFLAPEQYVWPRASLVNRDLEITGEGRSPECYQPLHIRTLQRGMQNIQRGDGLEGFIASSR